MHRNKVLIITYYWPPAGGPGVQRWLKFTKYLPENAWDPIVYIPENPSYPTLDASLVNEVSPELPILKNKIWEPYQIAEALNKNNKKFKSGQFDTKENQSWLSKLSIFVRGNFFIPDARKFWVKPSVKFLKKYLLKNPVEVIITTGPPHSIHLIGKDLKKMFPQIKWVADFRDPWTQISYYSHLKLTNWADKKHKRLEKQVFENADLTLATSFSDTFNFKKLGANAVTLTNGYDSERPHQREHKTEKFTLAYIGILEQLRNPKILWTTLENIVQENTDFVENFKLKLVGKIDNQIVRDLQNSTLINNVNLVGYLPHLQARNEMLDSDLLLITNFPKEESTGIIPGKLFEYLASGKEIISFGPPHSDVQKILEETNAGRHFNYEDAISLKEFILKCFDNWKTGKAVEHTPNIEKYSRKNLTIQLSNLLNQLMTPKSRE